MQSMMRSSGETTVATTALLAFSTLLTLAYAATKSMMPTSLEMLKALTLGWSAAHREVWRGFDAIQS